LNPQSDLLVSKFAFKSNLYRYNKAGLANVTATYINLMGYEAPADMEPSLIAAL
jgi:hypothetical protein